MQKLPDDERRVSIGVSMVPEAWAKVEGHAKLRDVSVSRVIEGLVLALPGIVGEGEVYERQDGN